MNSQETLPIDQGITEISVQGFKSLYEESRIEIRPLTILAGANSSGKSSIMQPLLLMKQTLEAPYDPGGLLLNGPNVKFTFVRQILSYKRNFSLKSLETDKHGFELKVKLNSTKISNLKLKNIEVGSLFSREKTGLSVYRTTIVKTDLQEKISKLSYTLETSKEIIIEQLIKYDDFFRLSINKQSNLIENFKFNITKNRFFWGLACNSLIKIPAEGNELLTINLYDTHVEINELTNKILDIIHLPGLRSIPKRDYPSIGVNERFLGIFDNYFASIIYQWRITQDSRIEKLNQYLQDLGLTSKVTARRPNDVSIELKVGLSKKYNDVLINIADVGFGVSQVLPVLVALLVAKPGQLVYLEQPELHLHPRAQANLAQPLIDAANRGVKVVVETHSDLLLTRIKTLVAEEAIDPAKLILHWFSRGDDGITKIDSKELDKVGAYGEFPIDFSDVFFEEDHRYINAASKQLLAKNKK
jgi:predicted ATPase